MFLPDCLPKEWGSLIILWFTQVNPEKRYIINSQIIFIYIFYYKENVVICIKNVHFVVEHNTQGIIFTSVGTNCLLLVQTWAIKQVIYKRLREDGNRAHVGFVNVTETGTPKLFQR